MIRANHATKLCLKLWVKRWKWSKNRTGENRTGEPRPSTRRPFRGHLRGMFRGEVLEGLKTGKSALVGAPVGALVGGLVGPLVDPLVGQISLSPALFAKTFACYRGHLGPSGPKWQRESEMSSRGLSAWGAQKVQNGVKKESRSTVFLTILTILTLFRLRFGLFGPLRPRGAGTHFGLSLPLWARRAQMTPVAGPENPKMLCVSPRKSTCETFFKWCFTGCPSRGGNSYCVLNNYYISNSKTCYSASASASVTVINSEINESRYVICNLISTSLQTWLQTYRNKLQAGLQTYRMGFWDSDGVPAITRKYMSVTDN